ncbi:MAG TPA: phosphohistidine phosphatase SixA [Gemmatimonadaceae bacterium]|nr:phosphohistidine phosphatase SixA [Gemmatimonadaceae bacterium]
MLLLVIRHAIAADQAEFARTGKTDDQRPLTNEGREKMRTAARGLREIIPTIDLLASSPYVRAFQTAEIVAQAYGSVEIQRTEALVPTSRPAALIEFLRGEGNPETAAVVGHEPHLSSVVSWLLTGRASPVLELKKGAACLVSFDAEPRGGGGILRWSLAPAHLRRLGS